MGWIKFVFRGAVKAYLSSPFFLSLLPLFVGLGLGLGLGFWVGRSTSKCGEQASKCSLEERRSRGVWVNLYRKCVQYMLRLQLLLVHLNPIRNFSSQTAMDEQERDEEARVELRKVEVQRESGVDECLIPRHIAVIMDGNRRYGKSKYGNTTRGHWDGSKTLIEFSKWCIAEGVQILTV